MLVRRSANQVSVPSTKIRALLGLDAATRVFSVIYGSCPEQDTEIAVLTRSILLVMIDFASYVDVPAADIAEGRVYNPQRTAEQARSSPLDHYPPWHHSARRRLCVGPIPQPVVLDRRP